VGATTPSTARAERRLREAIQSFAFQPRFGEEFNQALPLFFGEEVVRTRTLTASEAEMAEFQEWYFFDYPTSLGETIVDIFAREEGPGLSEKERELLDLWRRWNRYRLFEVQRVMPGIGIVVEDLLSGETLEIHDRSASHTLTRWTIFLARPFYTDRLHFTGSGSVLAPLRKGGVTNYSRQLLADFQARHPEATVDEFYRRHGLDIRQFMRREAGELPVSITPEGHEVEICSAYYRVADGEAVAERLDLAEEFNFAGPSGDRPGALHFNWLLRGRSHVPEQPRPEREALIHDSQWFLEPGSPKYRSLGDVSLWPNKLELNCMSQARLEAGKALLETLLGNLIRHRRDKIEPLEEFMARQPPTVPGPPRIPPDEAEAFERDTLREQFENWADEPREALGGKTAREAVRDPEGRATVIEVLKMTEYIQDRRRQAGEPWYDINLIRRELGLPTT
jgi:hypothetical protein